MTNLVKMKVSIMAILLTLSFFNPSWSQEKEVSFDKNYMENNDPKTTVEINEAQELIYIILAITDFGKENPNYSTFIKTAGARKLKVYTGHC